MPPPSSSLSITFDEIRPPLLPAVDNAHTHALIATFVSFIVLSACIKYKYGDKRKSAAFASKDRIDEIYAFSDFHFLWGKK